MHRKLHYDDKWLEYGFVDEAFLRQQVAQYDSSSDKYTEHYRYAAFREFLETAGVIDDLTLDRYVELTELDKDKEMGQAALGMLVGHRALTDQQLRRLRTHPAFGAAQLQDIVEQAELLRQLKSGDLTSDVFERCISTGKSELQRELINKPEISEQQLKTLKGRGANRAIRNLANEKLRRRGIP